MSEAERARYEADQAKHGPLPPPIGFRRIKPGLDPWGRTLIAVYPDGTFPIKKPET